MSDGVSGEIGAVRGSATADATAAYARRCEADLQIAPLHYRDLDGLSVSSIGLGTYLGDPDEETDILYTEAVIEAVRLGCNAIDSSINYRFQRSERSIGAAVDRLIRSGQASRDELVISTKGGYVAFDGDRPSSREEWESYLETTFFEPGVCTPADMACRMQHCMAPGYLDHQISQSLENLGLETVDVYYLHNPEGQLPEVGKETFELRLRAAFELLEAKVQQGAIKRYGTATWNGYRVDPHTRDYLSLERIVEIAHEVAGDGHHFRVVQLPFNLAMPEAYSFYNQPSVGEWLPLIDAARELRVSVVASGSLLQAQLAEETPPEVSDAFGFSTGAQCALQFVRSTPGISCALVGMKRVAHVRENMAIARTDPAPPDVVAGLFDSMDEGEEL